MEAATDAPLTAESNAGQIYEKFKSDFAKTLSKSKELQIEDVHVLSTSLALE